MQSADFHVSEVRRGIVRLHCYHWPHDCQQFDLVSMTLGYGQQGSQDSENPDEWDDWTYSKLRVLEDRIQRWQSAEQWQQTHDTLQDWVVRTRQAHAVVPGLAQYSDPNEATDALHAHVQTNPGWTDVQTDFADAVLSYIRENGIAFTNPSDE